jgi:hypothetical protein
LKHKTVPITGLAVYLAAAFLAVILYLPGINGGFLFDDYPNIVDNTAIQIQQLNTETLQSALSEPAAGPLGRPISVISFALTHYYFGMDPFAFKAVNLAIHLVNGLLVFWLMSLLQNEKEQYKSAKTTAKWLPIWVAIIWLLHPINSAPILLAVQRMTLLAGTFLLLATIFHIKGTSSNNPKLSDWILLGLSWMVCWPLAVLSKEIGLLFPVFALLVTLFRLLSKQRSGHGNPFRLVIIPFIILLISGGVLLSHFGTGWIDAGYAMRPFSLTERIMTELRVLWFYTGQILTPVHTDYALYLDDIEISQGLLNPSTTLMALIGWGVVLFIAIFYWKSWSVLSISIFWFLAGHSIESTILPLEIAHEYRNYIPSIGLILGVGYLGSSLINSFKLDHPRLTIGLVALFPIIFLSSITWMRSNQWSDTLAGSQLEAMHHPNSARANYMAAKELFSAGHGNTNDPIGERMIRYHFNKSAELDPNDKISHLGLIYWACASKRPIKQDWIIELSNRLKLSTFTPGDSVLPGNMLKLTLNNPSCLNRKETIALFISGSSNTRIPEITRSAFLDSAADYELLVSKDTAAATVYLRKAMELTPHNSSLRKKLDSFEKVNIEQRQIKPNIK